MEALPTPVTWDRPGLEAIGFSGFLPLLGLKPPAIPPEHGIYAVLRSGTDMPEFLEANPIKATRNKVYTVADLESKWINGATVVYIGKAAGNRGLSRRVGDFARVAANHSGGRSIWQLAEASSLLVAWMPCNDAERIERAFVNAFAHSHKGRLPFANRI